jgi:hypothetical protein
VSTSDSDGVGVKECRFTVMELIRILWYLLKILRFDINRIVCELCLGIVKTKTFVLNWAVDPVISSLLLRLPHTRLSSP